MRITAEEYLAHYGTPRHSGRYPWGSGDDENARNRDFLDYVNGMKKDGVPEKEIARGVGLTIKQLRDCKTIAIAEQKQAKISQAQRLADTGMSNSAIGREMGIPDTTVGNYLKAGANDRAVILQNTANFLKAQVDTKGYLDVGTGTEHFAVGGVSRNQMDAAITKLRMEGYEYHTGIKVEQLGTGQMTEYKILAPPGTKWSDVARNKDKIQSIVGYTEDGGRSYTGIYEPLSVSSKRVQIKYAEDGGDKADGVIYVRPGVDDISLGGKSYAQVRIAIDGTHYLKGMAMYKDDLPDGVDLQFNTNKSDTGSKLDAMKKMNFDKETGTLDTDNPFGSIVRQKTVINPDGSVKVINAMNKVNEEGSWDSWSKNLSSQMLSKQSPTLARTQLAMTYEQRKNELDSIMALTNPSVRKKLLETYAESTDSAAVHLKAAKLPRQSTHVILPINSLKENEIYAPNFNNGERVALVRYPHGGTFEIPELIVNNNHRAAKAAIGKQAEDAVGINSKVAERLSGADFDGDTVLVIPNDGGRIKSSPALGGLKNFDPKRSYPGYEGMPKMTTREKGQQMGYISNLITDMTIHGAPQDEIARAVRHSMVVIDAEKHGLNWQESARVNNISALMSKYQGRSTGGAATLISRAQGEKRVPTRKPRPAKDGGFIDKATGKKIYVNKNESFETTTKSGKIKIVPRTEKSKRLAEEDDAFALVSDKNTPMEKLYAEHSNRLKALANEARRQSVNTETIPYSPSAAKTYSHEVMTLNAKLALAVKNRPLERQAQVIANSVYKAKKAANPDMDSAETKKLKSLALAQARARMDTKKADIVITSDEWKAIQAGAISKSRLNDILNNADLDVVKKHAMPRDGLVLTSAKQARVKQMIAQGFTQADIAEQLGVGVTTLKTYLADA